MMKNLPVPVSDEDIEEMFEYADKNKDGKLSYKEFKVTNPKVRIKRTRNLQVMVNPPEPPTTAKPHVSELGLSPQIFNPLDTKGHPSTSASPILPTARTSFHSSSCMGSMTSISNQTKKMPIRTSLINIDMDT